MATSAPMVASIKGKVLIQLEGSEPVEVGEVEIPIYASTERPKHTRGQEAAPPVVTIDPTPGQTAEDILLVTAAHLRAVHRGA